MRYYLSIAETRKFTLRKPVIKMARREHSILCINVLKNGNGVQNARHHQRSFGGFCPDEEGKVIK